jgi:beta-xylosidase
MISWSWKATEKSTCLSTRLQKKIWYDKRYRRAIQDKTYNAHDRGEPYRLCPTADAIYTPIEETMDYLREYCHRDAKAKEQLEAYDFDALESPIRQRIHRIYDEYIADLEQKSTMENVSVTEY